MNKPCPKDLGLGKFKSSFFDDETHLQTLEEMFFYLPLNLWRFFKHRLISSIWSALILKEQQYNRWLFIL